MAKQRIHYIYKTTCLITGKFYVGMHSTDNLADGYLGSGKLLGYSRQKYGDENHSKEILEFCSSPVELKQREKEIVNEALLADPRSLNLKLGGEGGWDHIAGRNLTSPAFQTYKNSGRLAANCSKIVFSRTSESCVQANVKTWIEHRDTMLQAAQVGLAAMNTAEANEKRKATFAKCGHMQGEKNSQYGTCWVTDGAKPVKIKKEHLDEYLDKGFRRGRV